MKIDNIMCRSFSNEIWRRLVSHVDNGYMGSHKIFCVDRFSKYGYTYFSTNVCDDVSDVRVYFDWCKSGIEKIEILDPECGWREVLPDTYKRIDKFLDDFVRTKPQTD